MESVFRLVFTTSIYASIVGIFIIIFKIIIKNKISPRWHYVIWMILLLKLIVPYGPESSFSIFNRVPKELSQLNIDNAAAWLRQECIQIFDFSNAPISDNKKALSNLTDATLASKSLSSPLPQNISSTSSHAKASASSFASANQIAASNASTMHLGAKLSIIWSIGAFIFLMWLLFTNLSMSRKIRHSTNLSNGRINAIFIDCKEKMHINRDIQIVFQSIVQSPALFGVVNPKILLDSNLSWLDDKALSYILMHELAHYKRKDIFINYLLLILQAVHWFNPVMWYCFQKIRQDMEVATDEQVLAVLEDSEHKEYGKALLQILESFNTSRLAPKLICMVDDKKNTERRIKMIKMAGFFKSKHRLMLATGALCIFFLGGVLLTSGITNGSHKNNTVDGQLDKLLHSKTAYVGNNSKVMNLLNNLNYAESRGVISLQTKKAPYGITVAYNFNQAEKIPAKEEISKAFRYNAIMLFSLIDNVDVINFKLSGLLSTNYQYNRETIQQAFFKDVRVYSKNVSSLNILSNSINFTVFTAPEKYSAVMSSTPGIQISFNNINDSVVKYTASKGTLLTWDRKTGKIKNYGKSAKLNSQTYVYWSSLTNTSIAKDKTYINIEISTAQGKLLAEKRLQIDGSDPYTVTSGLDFIVSKNLKADPPKTSEIEKAISNAVLAKVGSYPLGEFPTEGHVVLGTEEGNGKVKVYAITSYAKYGFENNIFTIVSGSFRIPTVMTFRKNKDNEYLLADYKEAEDGSNYSPSIKRMFPIKYQSKVLIKNNYPEIMKQQEAHALEYLKSINRKAKVSTAHVEKKLPTINVEAQNKLFAEFTKYDMELNNFPYWLGTKEIVEKNGMRYIYETSQSKTSDGYNLMTFKKQKEDRAIVKEYNFKIVGKNPILIKPSSDIDSSSSIKNANSTKNTPKKLTLKEAEKLIAAAPLKEISYDDFWNQLHAQVYKFQKSKGSITSSYYVKDRKVIDLGYNSGGLDSKDICISDLDKDGKKELLYYYNFGSGLNISAFKCYVNGKQLKVNFGSIKFCGFAYIKKDMQNVELGVWYPDLTSSDKNSIPVGKLYIKNNELCIKLYDNLDPTLKDYIIIKK